MHYILGIDHFYQWKRNNAFATYIELILEDRKVSVIAEEFSKEACTKNHIAESVLKKISNVNHIAHIYLDPDSTERTKLGILDSKEIKESLGYGNMLIKFGSSEYLKIEKLKKSFWKDRENEWLKRILSEGTSNKIVLIVVGSDHVQRFSKRLNAVGLVNEIVNNDQFKTI